jgi:hypothetical protein
MGFSITTSPVAHALSHPCYFRNALRASIDSIDSIDTRQSRQSTLAAITPGNAPFAQVVGGKLHLHPISRHHTHKIQANFARKMRQYHAPTIQRYAKHCIG